MLIFRYLTREIIRVLAIVSIIFLFISISVQFVILLNRSAIGNIASDLLLIFIGIEATHILTVLLPFSLFITFLFVYGRFYADNEMTALYACGFNQVKLLFFTLPITTLIVLITAFLSLWAIPKFVAYQDMLLKQGGSAIAIKTTLPGRFQVLEKNHLIIYVERSSPDHKRMQNLFIAQLPPTIIEDKLDIIPWAIITGSKGYQVTYPKKRTSFFVVLDGQYYEGVPGQKNFQIAHFNTYGLRMKKQQEEVMTTNIESIPTSALWITKKKSQFSSAELHWRIAIPISVILLTLLSVPLSHIHPRQGKYTQLFPALLIYIIYLNFLIIGRDWINKNKLSGDFGLWWVHAGLLIIVSITWLKTTGWFSYKKIRFYYQRFISQHKKQESTIS